MVSNFLSSLGSGLVGNQPNAISRLLGSQIPKQAPIQTRAPTAAPSIPQAAPVAAPRQRRSVLDMIGGLADTIATVGEERPLYQTGIDARQKRQDQERTRQHQIEMEPLQRQRLEQQVRSGEQDIVKGDLDIAGGRAEIVDSAGMGLRNVFSKTGAPGLQKAWPLIAQQLGVTPEQQQAIGQALTADPEGTMAALFPEPQQKPQSLAAPVQVAEWLRENGTPEEFAAYRQSIANPEGMTEYQRRQLKLAEAKFKQSIIEFNNSQSTAAESKVEQAASSGNDDVTAILEDFGIDLTSKNDPIAKMISESTSGVIENYASMIPGALGKTTPGQENIGRLETIDNAIVLALAGGKLGAGVSNADRDFFKAMTGKISDPDIPMGKRQAAWQQIKRRLTGILGRKVSPSQSVRPRIIPRQSRGSTAAPSGNAAAIAEARRRGLIP